MASLQILSMGSVVKYRGEYDDSTAYYYLNMVTMYGSVFRATGNNFSNMPPIVVGADGFISLANTSVWDAIIDNTAIYNAAMPKIPWTDQVRTLNTGYAQLKTSLSQEIQNRKDMDDSFESKIGAKNGIAQLVNGLVPEEQLPSEMLGVVLLDFVRTDAVSTPSRPYKLGQYFYDQVANTLYGSYETEDGSYAWDSVALSDEKIYIDRKDKGIYLLVDGKLSRIAPNYAPALARIEQIASDIYTDRTIIERSIHGAAKNLNILFMEKEDYQKLSTYEDGVLYFVYQDEDLTPVAKPTDVVYYYNGGLFTPEPSKFYIWKGDAASKLGTYTFTAQLNPGYKWADNTKDEVAVKMTIKQSLIAKPVTRKFAFDGKEHTLVSNDMYTVEGKGGSAIGDYHFKVTLNYGYVWMDGSTDSVYIIYSIVEPVKVKWTFGSKFPIQFTDNNK